MIREKFRDDSQIWTEGTKKVNTDEWTDVVPQYCWSLVLQLACSCQISLIFHQLLLNHLCCFVRTFTLVVVDSSSFKMDEFFHQMAISFIDLKNLNSKINLSLPIDLIERSVLIIPCNCWVVCLSISPLVPLRPLVGLRPPLTFFVISLHLTMPTVSLSVLSKTQLQEALFFLSSCWCSHSDTHHLKRHMVGYGCHEILIPCPEGEGGWVRVSSYR